MLSWLNLLFDSVIFISYLVGILLFISLFFKTGSIGFKLRFVFFASYFAPVFLTFFKEMISLGLLKYFRLESIEEELKIIRELLKK